MELLHQFGFDPRLLLAQIVNFLLVLWVLRRFLYKPVLSMLAKRKQAIQEGIENAERANKLLEEMTIKEQKLLQNAQKQAQKIIEEAKDQATHIIKETEDNARERAEKIVAEAKQKIEYETKETERRLTEHVSKIAIDFLRHAVKELFTPKTQEELMGKALKIFKRKN